MLQIFIKMTFWILTLEWMLTACATSLPQSNPNATASPSPAPIMETPTLLPPESPPAALKGNSLPTSASTTFLSMKFFPVDRPRMESLRLISPNFVSVDDANGWLKDREPVVFVEIDDDARAYPIQILIWHEIVNDTLGGKPLLVSFCPLCNTAIAFEQTVNGQVFDFGTTGRLRYSNLIMYDRQTETWWQQATGDAIAGELTGTQLVFYPASIISWADFKSQYPRW